MKRKLTDQESELCKEGLEARQERIKWLIEEIEYFEEFNAFNLKFKKYREAKAKKDKEQKEVALKSALTMLKESLAEEQRGMTIEQDQLKNGVEIKKAPTGVS